MSRFCPALVAACLLLSACAPKLHYRITRINGVPSIAPPGYRDQTPPDVRVTIDGVTVPNAKTGDCNLSLNEFALEWGGGSKRRVVATVKLNALFPDGAYDEVARQAFHQFQTALETRGGEGVPGERRELDRGAPCGRGHAHALPGCGLLHHRLQPAEGIH